MKPRHTLLAAILAFAATAASAHDTWFERLPAVQGTPVLALGTGNRFPLRDSGIAARYLVASGCRAAQLITTLKPLRDEASALILQPSPGAATCWAQSAPFEVTLAPDKIALYLREIQASPEQRAAWADMQQRGLPWRERYAKHARIELGAPAAQPVPMAMDLVINHAGPLRAGDTLAVQVLRDGQPLAGLPVELVGEGSPLGIWRRSDAQGRLQVPVPASGRWLLRATELRLSETVPDTWDSRFVTLAFDAGAAEAQNGMSLSSNALSASQTAASTAISSEPPSSTTRR
jgi:hypothetical protein